MLAFLTLFLGLVSGVRPVELSAGEAVAAVEIRLDGKAVGRLASAPWSINVDFGDPPKPHELSAIAFDRGGKEVAKAFQRINLPRSLAEATLFLLPGNGGRGRFAQLTWQCAFAPKPTRTVVAFDGKPIPSPAPARIPLPDYVPEQLHFMKAELDFPRNVTAAAEITFGGLSRDETQAELTAVAVLSEKKLPILDRSFTASGTPLKLVAVEDEGPGEIAIVLDEAARPVFAAMAARYESGGSADLRPFGLGSGALMLKRVAPLSSGQRARFVWPLTETFEHGAMRFEIFPRSEDFDRSAGGLLYLFTHVFAPGVLPEPRLADAVSVAALSAVARNRARAVVLVLGGSHDASRLSPGGARSYLSALGVPLFVWTAGPRGPEAGAAWSGATDFADVSTATLLDKASSRLVAYVRRQRIVWVEGVHLPQDIGLSASASGLTLVR